MKQIALHQLSITKRILDPSLDHDVPSIAYYERLVIIHGHDGSWYLANLQN